MADGDRNKMQITKNVREKKKREMRMTKTKTKTKKKQANKQKKERNLSFKSLSHGWTLHLHRERNANSWHSYFVPCNSFHNVTEIWTLRSSSLKGMSVKGGPFLLLLSEQRYTRVLLRNVLMTQFIYRNLCFFVFVIVHNFLYPHPQSAGIRSFFYGHPLC